MRSSSTLDLDINKSHKYSGLLFFWDLCLLTILITYLEHRLPVSGDSSLFITTVKPHKKASKDSISWWIKLTMSEAGINSGLFTSHSCRSGSTSKAIEANWIGDLTFKKHYLRDIQQQHPQTEGNFGLKLLEQ